MPEIRKPTVMSAIDIGSYSLKLRIVEIDETGQVRTIEQLSKPASLGRDTFSTGKVSYATVEEACEIVTGFQHLMQEYAAKNYRAVTTSAIREAQNRDYLVDQIKLKTGLKVEVLTNTQERYLTYKAIRDNLPAHQDIWGEGVMVVEVGSGSVEMTLYHEGKLQRTHNMKLGHLRLRELLSSLEDRTQDFPRLLDEYVASHLDILNFVKDRYQLKHVIALGSEMRVISKLCNNTEDIEGLRQITQRDFQRLYDIITRTPTPLLAKEYGLPIDMAATLLPSMVVLKKSMEMTRADGLYTPQVSLVDGIVADFVDQRFNTLRQEEFKEDVQQLALALARKYHADMDHAGDVEEKALILFDALKKTHGMKEKEKQLLQLAAKLHDIGKFMNLNKHYIHSYNAIKASEILGLSEEELEIVANVARYHSSQVPQPTHPNYWNMRTRDRVVTAKLVAIIRIADALDRSHRQKISQLKVLMKGQEMVLRGESKEDTLLEEWTFDKKSEFFQEVFGIRPLLKVKRKMANE